MNIGIFVHSLTGNTLFVATQLKEKLLQEGYAVQIVKIEIDGEENTKINDPAKLKLKSHPDIKPFDFIILGSPVRGGNISPAISAYISNIKTFDNRRTMCFVTQYFPFPWMGGNQAIKKMRVICEKKGAKVLETAVVNWKNRNRTQKIDNMIKNFSEYF